MINTINGIDASESVLTATNNDVYYSQKAVDELQNNIKRLQEENEELKKRCEELDKMTGIFSVRLANKYKQALEEIRKKITPVCACCNNIDGFTTLDDCENVCENGVIKYLKIIDEALDDRD